MTRALAKSNRFWLAAMAAAAAFCLPAISAQDGSLDLRALDQGTLNVWVVRPANQKRPKSDVPVYNAPQPGFHEATTGGLGQNAGSFGRDAGSYGVDASSTTISAPSSPTAANARAPGDTTPAGSGYTEQSAGSFGQNSGGFGHNAGGYGQTTGGLGEDSASVGQNAGSYGHTLSNFGDSLSTLGQPKKLAPPPFRIATRGPSNNAFEQELHNAFPDLKVAYSDIYADELTATLAAAAGSSSYPDVLLGGLKGAGWQKVEGRYGAAVVRPADFVPDGLSQGDGVPEYAVVAGAPHAAAAQAFVLWASEIVGGCVQCGVRSTAGSMLADETAAAAVAVRAMGNLLKGEGVGSLGDPAMASWSASLGTNVLRTDAGRSVGDGARVTVVRASVDGALAAVTLRVVAGAAYGAAHPLVVLRKTNGAWRVLQVSLNLPPAEAERARVELIRNTAPASNAEQQSGVRGVTLRSPDNGSQLQAEPALGWDNGGGAGLQVVEWQNCTAGPCGDSHLYFVPDQSQRLRTGATAEFAAADGKYRWRVWSVGAAGAMKLSAWRTFTVTQ